MLSISQQRPISLRPPFGGQIAWTEILFCLALLSTNFPIKVYPVLFILSGVLSLLECRRISFPLWAWGLVGFAGYAVGSYLLVEHPSGSHLSSMLKLCVNFFFLFASTQWLLQRENSVLLKWLDYTLHLSFILFFAQLLLYHEALGFRLLLGSSSSGQASMLYSERLYFWGLADKNMFGARIALLGLIYMLIPTVRWSRFSIWRMLLVFFLAYISLSRTPVVALLIGVLIILWTLSTKWIRVGIIVLILGISPFLMEKVLRVDQLTASNDGMGVRLTYYKAFFENIGDIPLWGMGFMNAPEFLKEQAEYYHGEPHIHNTFLSSYLELGIVGLVTFMVFLVFYLRQAFYTFRDPVFWLSCFLPLIAIMSILYSGYDNDPILYLILVFLLIKEKGTMLKECKLSL